MVFLPVRLQTTKTEWCFFQSDFTQPSQGGVPASKTKQLSQGDVSSSKTFKVVFPLEAVSLMCLDPAISFCLFQCWTDLFLHTTSDHCARLVFIQVILQPAV